MTRAEGMLEIGLIEAAMDHLERTLFTSNLPVDSIDHEARQLIRDMDLVRQRFNYLLHGTTEAPAPVKKIPHLVVVK